MPLDIRCIRNDPRLLQDLERSLRLRRSSWLRQDGDGGASDHDDDDENITFSLSVLKQLTRKDASMLRALTEQNEFRRLVKHQTKNERESNKRHLKQLEATLQQEQAALHKILIRIPNYVDEQLLEDFLDLMEASGEEKERGRAMKGDLDHDINKDRLFCVGGYERINAGPHQQQQCVLTGIGMDLLLALQRSVLDFVRSTLCSDSQCFELPMTLDLLEDDYHSRWGHNNCYAPVATLSSCDEAHYVAAPSWMSFLQKRHAGKTYFDRNLPLFEILVCSGPPTSSSAASVAPRKDHNDESILKGPIVKQKHYEWYECTAVQHEIQLLALTGSSLRADSRKVQLEIMQTLLEYYQELAPSSRLRLRAIPPDELQPAEASRIVLEASLPQEKNTMMLTLASLSNLLDYASPNVRHGNSTTSQEKQRRRCIHVLQGSLCRLETCLEWILLQADSDSQGVNLPLVLLPNNQPQQRFPKNGILPLSRLECQHQVIQTKKGERRVARRKEVAMPMDLQPRAAVEATNLSLLTPEEIRLEALACPFGFLPFYYR